MHAFSFIRFRIFWQNRKPANLAIINIISLPYRTNTYLNKDFAHVFLPEIYLQIEPLWVHFSHNYGNLPPSSIFLWVYYMNYEVNLRKKCPNSDMGVNPYRTKSLIMISVYWDHGQIIYQYTFCNDYLLLFCYNFFCDLNLEIVLNFPSNNCKIYHLYRVTMFHSLQMLITQAIIIMWLRKLYVVWKII